MAAAPAGDRNEDDDITSLIERERRRVFVSVRDKAFDGVDKIEIGRALRDLERQRLTCALSRDLRRLAYTHEERVEHNAFTFQLLYRTVH